MVDCNVSARFVSPRKAQHIEDVIPDDMIEHIAAELFNGFFDASPFALEEVFSAEFFDLYGSTMFYTRTEVNCGRTITAEDLFCRDRNNELVNEALENLIEADTEDVEAAAHTLSSISAATVGYPSRNFQNTVPAAVVVPRTAYQSPASSAATTASGPTDPQVGSVKRQKVFLSNGANRHCTVSANAEKRSGLHAASRAFSSWVSS